MMTPEEKIQLLHVSESFESHWYYKIKPNSKRLINRDSEQSIVSVADQEGIQEVRSDPSPTLGPYY